MTSISDGVAVIATQVAQTDRRSLSEAWYSALHLAHPAQVAPGPKPRKPTDPPPQSNHALPSRREGAPLSSRTEDCNAIRRRVSAKAQPIELPVERRRPVTAAAQRIERAVVRLTGRRPVPAAHTVDVAGGRVRLLVHTDGRTTRIVAVCSSPQRDVVERALASARFTLAGAGVAVAAP